MVVKKQKKEVINYKEKYETLFKKYEDLNLYVNFLNTYARNPITIIKNIPETFDDAINIYESYYGVVFVNNVKLKKHWLTGLYYFEVIDEDKCKVKINRDNFLLDVQSKNYFAQGRTFLIYERRYLFKNYLNDMKEKVNSND